MAHGPQGLTHALPVDPQYAQSCAKVIEVQTCWNPRLVAQRQDHQPRRNWQRGPQRDLVVGRRPGLAALAQQQAQNPADRRSAFEGRRLVAFD